MWHIALLHPEKEGGYSVTFPDFPGCFTQGDTMDEAASMAEDALEGHVECLLEDGDPLPSPSRLEQIEHAGAVPILIRVPGAPRRHVRVSITVPEDDLRDIDAFVKDHGLSRSGFLVHAAKHRMLEIK